MQIKTILNKCHKFKRFVCGRAYFEEHAGKPAIHIEIEARKNSQGICSRRRRVRTSVLALIASSNSVRTTLE